MATIRVDNPFTGETACEVPVLELGEAERVVQRAAEAQRSWRRVPVEERVKRVCAFNQAFAAQREPVAREITQMMGKPIEQARREVDTLLDRSAYMASIAHGALADELLPEKPGLARKIVREPVGVVLDVAPWNYPLLTAVNAIVPAVLAGNAVVIKHSSRTPRCGDHFAQAFARAGAPDGLVAAFQASHATIEALVQRPEVGLVAFTGSVAGGHQIYAAAARRFIDAGLELGGKDPAYVAPDAHFEHAVENLVDGAFYNAGQSCCGIERIYVHASIYERFLEAAVALVERYRLGDPLDPQTTMGPMAQPEAPAFLERQVVEARARGARVLCGGAPATAGGRGRFFAPAVVADATHAMSIMVEESFGPVVGIAPVQDDAEAVARMNDSPFGLTCAVWTEDPGRAERMARELETGTVYMNRCDYLDPALPWAGVKDSGKGCTLSHLGFNQLTRLKSYHFRVKTR